LNQKLDFKAKAFHCPHCGVYAKQNWHNAAKGAITDKGLGFYEGFIPNLYLSFCSKCGKYSIWLNDKIIYPTLSTAPWPTKDMPANVKENFLEARNIVSASPKAASALLRLCLQKLMIHLGEKGKNLDVDVTSLVRKGLPTSFREAIRAVNSGNPGEINSSDGAETALALFDLVNMIVDQTITQPKKKKPMYIVLPDSKPLRKRQVRKRVRKSKKSEVIPKPTLLYR